MPFADRVDAGRRLAERLEHLRDSRPVVVGLPRGGVPVAAAVAQVLAADLDVIMVRKLGVPSQPELAFGAIGEDDVRILTGEVVAAAGVDDGDIEVATARERAELDRRALLLRSGAPPVPLTGRVVIVVDDGLATGSTARAACQVARARQAGRVVLAVPVAPSGWERRLAGTADEFACVIAPESFYAVGQFYRDFSPTTDDEVVTLLRDARRPR